MKKLLAMLFATAVLSACHKDKTLVPNNPPTTIVPATLKKDSSSLDQTVQTPKNNQLIYAGILNTGSISGFTVTTVKVSLKQGGDAASPVNYLRRIYFVIEDAVAYTSDPKDSVTTAEFTFPNFLKNFPQYQNRGIRVYADILSSATNGTGLVDDLKVSVQLSYNGRNGNDIDYFVTPMVEGQKITFGGPPPVFTVSSVADPATPASGVILDGQEKEALRYGVKLTGVSGNVTEHRLLVQGQATNAVTALKLFDGPTFIAQANVSNGVATIVTNDAISAGAQKNYIVKPIVSVTTGDVSNYDFTVTLDAVKAVSTAGEQKTDGTDRSGNPFTVLKAILDIKKVAVPTLLITNGAMDLYTVDLTAVNGDVSLKELTYDILLNDQGADDTLFAKNFQIFNGSGLDITNQFRFTDVNSNIDTLFSESDSKLRATRISGTGETIIPNGTTLRLRFRAVIGGFNHPLDGDGFSVIPVVDVVSSIGLKFLNSGGLTNGNAKLHSSATPSGSAVNFYIVWSDISSPNHNGQFVQTSNDWLCSQRATINLSVNNFHQ